MDEYTDEMASVRRGGHDLYTLIIPLNYNDGRMVSYSTREMIISRLAELTKSGLTCYAPGVGLDVYGDGQIDRDSILPVQISVPAAETHKIKPVIMQVAAEIAEMLMQRSIYVTVQQISVLLVSPTPLLMK